MTDPIAPDRSETTRPIRPLDDPMPPLTVLYDDLCEFCRWTAERLRRWDRARLLRFRPFHDATRAPILGQLVQGRDLSDHVHAVDAAGRFAVGSEAVLSIISLLPRGRPVTRLFAWSPPASVALHLLYRLLNRRRGLLVDVFHLDGGLLREPSGLEPISGELGPATS